MELTLRAGLNRPDSTATTCRTPAAQAGVRLCRQNRLSVIRFVPIRITKGSNGTSHRESSRGTARSWVLHDQTLGPERQGPNNPDRRRPSSGRGFRDRAVARPPTTCGTSARDRPVRRRIVGRLERTQSSLGIHRRGACGWSARSDSASRGRPSPYCRYHGRRGSGAQAASGRRCDCNREIHRGDDRATIEAKHSFALTVNVEGDERR